jgi:uncharacterized BrkB/YihY/UPF0761 family membrane protein
MANKKVKRDFWLFGALGSLVLGFGLCLLVESGFAKHSDAPTWHWVSLGTLSLILIMSGVNFLFRSFEAKLVLKDARREKN